MYRLLLVFIACVWAVEAQIYSCNYLNNGGRVHEMTSPTPYDCVNTDCSNSCHGGQCVALVTCSCTRNGNHVPGTSCWRQGQKVARSSDNRCDSTIPANTAIATFRNNAYYAGHAAIFTGCDGDFGIRVYDQWCCGEIGYRTYGTSSSLYADFYVIDNPGVCSDRSSWDCRWESRGPNCCPTSVSGCLKHKYWWQPFMTDE